MALTPAGGGHTSVARAVKEALAELAPDAQVSDVNVFSPEYASFPLTVIPRMYARLTVDMPMVWRGVFRATDELYEPVARLAHPIMRPALLAAVESARPDVIVSLNPAIGYTLRRAVRELGWHTPLGVVISDLVKIHPAWVTLGAAWHAVPTEDARAACVAGGVDPDTIHVTGLPVGQGFCRLVPDRAALRRSLGLPLDERVVLVVGGGEGSGAVEETVGALQASELHCHLAVVTGRNVQLRRRMLRRWSPASCKVLGYVGNMADWMRAADVLVTKAGPNTIMEAVHCGLPMVLTGAIPGQEEANLVFAAANNLALSASRPAAIVRAVARLLNDRRLVAQMRRSMERLRRPEAARQIAQLILSC